MRKAIPKDEVGIDIKIPEEEQIVSDLERIRNDPLPYQAAYNWLLDSGLRLVEVAKLLSDFPESERLEGFDVFKFSLLLMAYGALRGCRH